MTDSQVIKFWSELFGEYKKSKRCSLLDVGCGKGNIGLILTGNAVKSYCGIDPEKEAIEEAKKRAKGKKDVEYKVGKAERIPYRKKFDILFFTFSWHFIKNFEKAIKEASRVLRKDGIIVIVEPNERTKNWGDPLLNTGGDEFSESEYNRNLITLEKGKEIIYSQKRFNILEERMGDENSPNIWVLGRKSGKNDWKQKMNWSII